MACRIGRSEMYGPHGTTWIAVAPHNPRPGRSSASSASEGNQRPRGNQPNGLWNELPECSGSAPCDCTFGCILLRIKFCMHPVNYILRIPPAIACNCIRLLSGLRPAALVSFQRTNRTEYLRNVSVCLALIKSLAVNSLNLMETGPKFCTAEERAAGPCLTHVPRP